jgi:cell division protein FtsA
MPDMRPRGQDVLGVLDMGTSKVVCLAVAVRPARRRGEVPVPTCLGVGHQRSAGVRDGVVVDVAAAEEAVRAAVSQAERQGRVRLDAVLLALGGARLRSLSFAAHATTARGTVRHGDLARILADAHAYAERDGQALLHLTRRGYRLDDAPCGDDPRGMAARRLTADMHAVVADPGAVRHALLVAERSHLTVDGLVAAPYASALAVTTPDERQLGVTVVDLGAGTTGMATFVDGMFVHGEVLARGGHTLSVELAKIFRAQVAEAERIKTLYASLVNVPSDAVHKVAFARVDDGAVATATRSEITRIVTPPVVALLTEIATRRTAVGAERLPVVLTGGASQLVGLVLCAARVFDADVRLGRTATLPGMGPDADTPAFATAVGLVRAALDATRLPAASSRVPGPVQALAAWLSGAS